MSKALVLDVTPNKNQSSYFQGPQSSIWSCSYYYLTLFSCLFSSFLLPLGPSHTNHTGPLAISQTFQACSYLKRPLHLRPLLECSSPESLRAHSLTSFMSVFKYFFITYLYVNWTSLNHHLWYYIFYVFHLFNVFVTWGRWKKKKKKRATLGLRIRTRQFAELRTEARRNPRLWSKWY